MHLLPPHFDKVLLVHLRELSGYLETSWDLSDGGFRLNKENYVFPRNMVVGR